MLLLSHPFSSCKTTTGLHASHENLLDNGHFFSPHADHLQSADTHEDVKLEDLTFAVDIPIQIWYNGCVQKPPYKGAFLIELVDVIPSCLYALPE